MMVGVAAVVLVLNASPGLGVVVGKRSGVSAPVAAARAAAARAALGPRFADAPIDDFTACASKRPCLVKEAQGRQWKALVIVETATIINEALVKVTLLSIDDDGRQVATASAQAAEPQLPTTLDAAFGRVRQELETLLPAPPEPSELAPIATPAPVVALQRPEPAPASTVALGTTAVPAGKPAARWIPAGVGVALLGAGVGLTVASQGVARRLEAEAFVDERTVEGVAREGAALQTAGVALLVAGASAALGGVALALLWPEAQVAPAAMISKDGAIVGLSGVLP